MMKLHAIARRIITDLIITDLHQVDVLILPVLMHPIIRVGEWAKLRAAKELEHIINWIAPCPPFNVTGQLAISVPVGFTPENLPLGVQLMGRPGDETTILTLAAQIEATKPWSHHRPKFAC